MEEDDKHVKGQKDPGKFKKSTDVKSGRRKEEAEEGRGETGVFGVM